MPTDLPPNAKSQNQRVNGGNSSIPPQTICHKEFYLEGGDLYVLISPIYIRVHSYFFTRSTANAFFKSFIPEGENLDLSALPGTGGPEKAIIIRNATVEEFSQFLWIFYNEKIDDYSRAKLPDWFTILRLAHEWGFQGIKDLALRYIKTFEHEMPNVVDRIAAYEKYSPPAEMLLPLYVELVGRDELPTDIECAILGDAKALKIYRARETIFRAQKKANGRLELTQVKALVAKTLCLTETPTSINGANAPDVQQLQDKQRTGTDGRPVV